MTQNKIMEIIDNAGICISTAAAGVGRELAFSKGLKRTVVIHFADTDFPGNVKKTLGVILESESQWFLIKRYGDLEVKQFTVSELPTLLSFLISVYSRIKLENDDLYIIGANGKAFLSYNHHMFSNGLPVFLSDVSVASTLLLRLNELGAEFELFSKNG
ncbi:hypothetical protein [Desulforegula conservatrix]|uniref:hypothetical protein n=1 Tax=Desulforegula conservatrix TaxID=153026 RepID=UPI0012EC4D15|nr:hypothetical protein [Desulforegula conservatrix]